MRAKLAKVGGGQMFNDAVLAEPCHENISRSPVSGECAGRNFPRLKSP
jgi:hypothetical protein